MARGPRNPIVMRSLALVVWFLGSLWLQIMASEKKEKRQKRFSRSFSAISVATIFTGSDSMESSTSAQVASPSISSASTALNQKRRKRRSLSSSRSKRKTKKESPPIELRVTFQVPEVLQRSELETPSQTSLSSSDSSVTKMCGRNPITTWFKQSGPPSPRRYSGSRPHMEKRTSKANVFPASLQGKFSGREVSNSRMRSTGGESPRSSFSSATVSNSMGSIILESPHSAPVSRRAENLTVSSSKSSSTDTQLRRQRFKESKNTLQPIIVRRLKSPGNLSEELNSMSSDEIVDSEAKAVTEPTENRSSHFSSEARPKFYCQPSDIAASADNEANIESASNSPSILPRGLGKAEKRGKLKGTMLLASCRSQSRKGEDASNCEEIVKKVELLSSNGPSVIIHELIESTSLKSSAREKGSRRSRKKDENLEKSSSRSPSPRKRSSPDISDLLSQLIEFPVTGGCQVEADELPPLTLPLPFNELSSSSSSSSSSSNSNIVNAALFALKDDFSMAETVAFVDASLVTPSSSDASVRECSAAIHVLRTLPISNSDLIENVSAENESGDATEESPTFDFGAALNALKAGFYIVEQSIESFSAMNLHTPSSKQPRHPVVSASSGSATSEDSRDDSRNQDPEHNPDRTLSEKFLLLGRGNLRCSPSGSDDDSDSS